MSYRFSVEKVNLRIIPYFCLMEFLYVKAIHIVFVVSWFAAMFYIVRLFIYASEAHEKEEPERRILTSQLLLMQRRLWYIIGWPAMIGTYIFGWWMIYLNPQYLYMPWMLLKLSAVVFLTVYHLICERILRQQNKDLFTISSFRLRMLNELSTVLLVAIVFLVVLKSTSGLLWGVVGLLAFAGTLMLAVSIYRRARKK